MYSRLIRFILVGTLLLQMGCAMTAPLPMYAEGEKAEEYMQGYMQGKADAKGDTIWAIAGFGCGIFAVAFAYGYTPVPPADALMGKSLEYVTAYTQAYQVDQKNKNMNHALVGAVIGAGVVYILWLMPQSEPSWP